MNLFHQQRNFHSTFPRFFLRVILVGTILLTLVMTGCSLMRFSGSQPKAQVDSLQLSSQSTGPVTMTVLQAQVMRFADTYSATVAQACDDVTTATTNIELRESVLRWKLGQSTAAYINATGQNPAVNALDMLVLVSMARMVVQDYGSETYGDEVRPLLETQLNLETNAWTLARGVLRPSQEKELRDLIQEWRAKNPHQRYVGPVRFREFVTALGKTPTQATTAPTSIFSLLYLDPLAGLDPTAAAIQETREMGERAMYYTQRMPMLLSWQVELLAYRLAGQPESQQILNDASRLAASAEIFAKTAQQLPQVVNDQRQAAIQQILDGLTSQGNKSRELLNDTRSTLDAAGAAAKNIDAAVQSLTAFVQYVSPTNVAPTSSTNSQPFNVLNYGTAATQIGAAADHLNALLATVNQTTPELTAQTKAVVDHAFWRGLILILALLIGAVLAALGYRLLASRFERGTGDRRKN